MTISIVIHLWFTILLSLRRNISSGFIRNYEANTLELKTCFSCTNYITLQLDIMMPILGMIMGVDV